MKKIILLSIVSIGIFASCGKDSTTTTIPTTTTAQKAQKKWRIVNIQDITYVGQSTTVDTIEDNLGALTDSIEFKSNNIAPFNFQGDVDSIPYQILSDTKLTLDGDTFTINTLDANNFVFTNYDRASSDYYDNVIILKR